MTIFFFLVLATGLGTLIYLVLVHGSVPGSLDERLGSLEPLPPDVGKWVTDDDSSDGRAALARGQIREVRHLEGSAAGLMSKPHLIKQVRYRDAASGEVERVEPEQRVPRKRRKASAE